MRYKFHLKFFERVMVMELFKNALKIMRGVLVSNDLNAVMSMAKLKPLDAGEAISLLEEQKLVYYDKDGQIKLTMEGHKWYAEAIENPILKYDTKAFKDEALTGMTTGKSKASGFTVSKESKLTSAVL
jgi:hypothetical protein